MSAPRGHSGSKNDQFEPKLAEIGNKSYLKMGLSYSASPQITQMAINAIRE